MDKARKAAAAYAIEHNLCIGRPYGCGDPVAPLIVAGDLRVLVSTKAGGDGPQIEANAFPTQEAYDEWLKTGNCPACQQQFALREG